MIAGRLKGKIMDKLGVRVEEYILKMREDVDDLSNKLKEKTGGDNIGKTPRSRQEANKRLPVNDRLPVKNPKEPKPFIPIEERLATGSNTSVLYTYNAK